MSAITGPRTPGETKTTDETAKRKNLETPRETFMCNNWKQRQCFVIPHYTLLSRACQTHIAKLVEALHSATSATLEMAPVSQGHENMKTKYTFLSTLCQYTGQAAKPLKNSSGGKRPLDFSKTSKKHRGKSKIVTWEIQVSQVSQVIFNLGLEPSSCSHVNDSLVRLGIFQRESQRVEPGDEMMKSQVFPAPSYHWLFSTFNIHTDTYKSVFKKITYTYLLYTCVICISIPPYVDIQFYSRLFTVRRHSQWPLVEIQRYKRFDQELCLIPTSSKRDVSNLLKALELSKSSVLLLAASHC